MRRLILFALLALHAGGAGAQDWILATQAPNVRAGSAFEVDLVSLGGDALPARISLRVRDDRFGRIVVLQAKGPASGPRRTYVGRMPTTVSGTLALELVDRPSSVLVLLVEAAPDVIQQLTSRPTDADALGSGLAAEPPLSQNEPMYIVFGRRGGASARFQLSFKYRLFDKSAGFGKEQPWLSGFYFGYTQNSLWDLSSESKPFRDTSYRPSLFWRWERTDDKTWIDAVRAGYEHESNGRDGASSRSIDTLFVRPEWHWTLSDGSRIEFAPKFIGYVDKEDNPDIHRYRGYVDWDARYARGNDWVLNARARLGTSGKGSLLLDLSTKTRAIQFGPVSGYLHLQYFTGYGEDILGYNERRKSQLRLGFAIVP
jgi:phospholipase A1/A2